MGRMAKDVTRDELDQYFELDMQRLALARKVSDIEKLQEQLEEKFLKYVEHKGGIDRTTIRYGYRLAIQTKNGSVSWKGEYMKLAGQEAAEKLIQAAPKKDKLTIEPPPKSVP